MVRVISLVLCCLWGCGDSQACSERRLTILEPLEGASLTGAETTVVVEACGFERDEVVRVLLLDPVETDYAFITVFDDPIVSTTVPLLPGTLRMQATDLDDTIRSPVVSFEASP